MFDAEAAAVADEVFVAYTEQVAAETCVGDTCTVPLPSGA